jgi:hypothetical protein
VYFWLSLALAQQPTEIRPDDSRPTESIDLGGERGEVGIKKRIEPAFPEQARAAGLTYGRCVADVDVADNGTPGKPTFVDCPEVFQRSAMEAIRQWRWHVDDSGDGTPAGAKTRVIIDYRDDSDRARLADPDPLETPMGEFQTLEDAREVCVGSVAISGIGDVQDKAANRLPDCIFEPSEVAPVLPKVLPSQAASCTASFVTDRGYAMKIRFRACDKAVRSATSKNLRTWTWPWTPDGAVAYEMTFTYLPN